MSIANLTALIPFRNGHATIARLLDSLPADLPVLVVDDLSDPPYVATRSNVRVIRLAQRGYFAGACNAGIAACDTDVLVLNQDVTLEGAQWLDLLARRDEFAMGGDGVFSHPSFTAGYCQGTFLWITRPLINTLGTVFDEQLYPLWGCTALAQLRACRLGFKALPVRMAEYGMVHERGAAQFGSAIAATLQEEPERKALLVRTPPAISVVIASYNHGRYLADAVNSLIGGETSLGVFPPQTFQSFEIIIVDDASKDKSREIGAALADPWRGIRFIARERNGGSAAAANTGIAQAHGKYITVLDADDMMEPTRLEQLYRLAEQNPHRVIYDDLMMFKAGKRLEVLPLADYDFDKCLWRNQMHKGIFYERAAWKEVSGYPERMKEGREDWAMNVALGAKGYCGVRLAGPDTNITAPLYLYRREGQNRSLTNTGAEWRDFFLNQLTALFPNLYAGERPMGCCGSGSRNRSNGNSRSAPAVANVRGRAGGAFMTVPGQQGFVQLEYQLDRAGSVQYRGAVTGAGYVFGGQRRLGYVDPRDAEQLLGLFEGRRQVFRVYVPRQVSSPAPATVSPATDDLTAPDAATVAALEDQQTGGALADPSDDLALDPSLRDVDTRIANEIAQPEIAEPAPRKRAPRKSKKPEVAE